MPWDTIGKSDYTQTASLNKVVPVLTGLYQQRSQTNPAYKAYYNVIKAYQDDEALKSIPLNAQELKRVRDANAAKALDRENQLRVAIGLPALKKGEARPRTDDLDFMKTEAGQILTDYILSDKTSAGI